jgi:hypothetical protein
MPGILASILVAAAGIYFVCFGLGCFFAPERISRFLHGFASSAIKHYAELAVRLVVGGALIRCGPSMLLPTAFVVLGWVFVGTTAVLFCIPWSWHRRIAERSVPRAVRHLGAIGAVALAFGVGTIAALLGGPAF